jgi:hypothetical protein
VINGRRQTLYARVDLSSEQQLAAAEDYALEQEKAAEAKKETLQ